MEQPNNGLIDQEPSELTAFIRREKRPVDYHLILDQANRVLFIGQEYHIMDSATQELIDSLSKLKDNGFTHLAMEMLDSDMQPILDENNCSTGAERERVY